MILARPLAFGSTSGVDFGSEGRQLILLHQGGARRVPPQGSPAPAESFDAPGRRGFRNDLQIAEQSLDQLNSVSDRWHGGWAEAETFAAGPLADTGELAPGGAAWFAGGAKADRGAETDFVTAVSCRMEREASIA